MAGGEFRLSMLLRPGRGSEIERRRRHVELRDHNESDLEEIEEEREKKNKDIDEDQKADDPAGQRDQKVLHPSVSIDAVEGQREDARADQDEHNEGGQLGRDLRGLARQIPA